GTLVAATHVADPALGAQAPGLSATAVPAAHHVTSWAGRARPGTGRRRRTVGRAPTGRPLRRAVADGPALGPAGPRQWDRARTQLAEQAPAGGHGQRGRYR